MIYFFDTSALVKCYTTEKGSEEVAAIIQDSEAYIFISELTCVEIKSSFATKCRMGQITQDEWKTATESFDELLRNFYITPVNNSAFQAATDPVICRKLCASYIGRDTIGSLSATYLSNCNSGKRR